MRWRRHADAKCDGAHTGAACFGEPAASHRSELVHADGRIGGCLPACGLNADSYGSDYTGDDTHATARNAPADGAAGGTAPGDRHGDIAFAKSIANRSAAYISIAVPRPNHGGSDSVADGHRTIGGSSSAHAHAGVHPAARDRR